MHDWTDDRLQLPDKSVLGKNISFFIGMKHDALGDRIAQHENGSYKLLCHNTLPSAFPFYDTYQPKCIILKIFLQGKTCKKSL